MALKNNTDVGVAPTCLSGFCHCSLIVYTLDPGKGGHVWARRPTCRCLGANQMDTKHADNPMRSGKYVTRVGYIVACNKPPIQTARWIAKVGIGDSKA